MSAMEQLDCYLEREYIDYDVDEMIPNDQRFRIETKDQVIWAMRRIAGIEKDRQDAREVAQREINRIKAWLEQEEKRADTARRRLDALLEDYHRRVLAENPKAKTIHLPHGTLKLRSQQPEWKWDDEQLLPWLQQNLPHYVREKVTYIPDKAALKKAVQVVNSRVIDPHTGEVVPGVEVEMRPEKFIVEVEGL